MRVWGRFMRLVVRALRPIAGTRCVAPSPGEIAKRALFALAIGLTATDALSTTWQAISTGTFISEASARRGERRNRQRSDVPSAGFDEPASRQSPGRENSSSIAASSSSTSSSSNSSSAASSSEARSERSSAQNERVGKTTRNDNDDRTETADRQDDNAPRGGGREERRSTARTRSVADRPVDQPESRPPATLAEAFDRLVSPPAAKAATLAAPVAKPTPAPHKPAVAPDHTQTSGQVLARNPSPSALEAARRLGFKVSQQPPAKGRSDGLVRLIPPPGMSSSAAIASLRPHVGPQGVHYNWTYRIYRQARHGDDPQAQRIQPARAIGSAVPCQGDKCFGRRMIGWHAPLESCAAGLKVGVIDTDVDLKHPAFARRSLRSESFVAPDKTPAPKWHGTGVLALLAGHEQSGTPGLIPKADLFVASVFFKESDGGFATDTASIVSALRWMADNKVQVVNMSFAGPRDALVQEWIEKLSARGMVFVAAAGNEGPHAPPSFPAAYPKVIAVTAVNRDKRGFSIASRGDHIDVAAPGVDIWTAVPAAREGYYSGTSFAAPFATAVVAVAYRDTSSKDKTTILSGMQIQDLGATGRDQVYGRGMLSAPSSCNQQVSAERPQPVPANGAPVIRATWPSNGGLPSPSGIGAASATTRPR